MLTTPTATTRRSLLPGRIEEFDIYWFEEPCGADDYEGHARVVAATSIPIATGENEYTRYGFRDLIEHRAASILQPDANILGGVTEFRKVADLAAAHDLAVSPHGSQDVHIHLVTAIPTGLILEFYRDTVDPLWDQKFKETLRLGADGMLAPPNKPGFGFEPNYRGVCSGIGSRETFDSSRRNAVRIGKTRTANSGRCV